MFFHVKSSICRDEMIYVGGKIILIIIETSSWKNQNNFYITFELTLIFLTNFIFYNLFRFIIKNLLFLRTESLMQNFSVWVFTSPSVGIGPFANIYKKVSKSLDNVLFKKWRVKLDSNFFCLYSTFFIHSLQTMVYFLFGRARAIFFHEIACSLSIISSVQVNTTRLAHCNEYNK